jgi:hypothetical protein
MAIWGVSEMWLAALVFGPAASAIYFLNAPSHEAIDFALKIPSGRGPAVGLLTVCKRGDADNWDAYNLIPPERLWCHAKAYIDAFRDRASANKSSFGDTALQCYLKPVLMWSDVAFAISLGLFAALADIAIAVAIPYASLQVAFLGVAVAGRKLHAR